jgi:peptidoglycan/xylan/chitin deacetylase (PgdA/CDA1 family)
MVAEALKLRPETERIKLMRELFRALKIDSNNLENENSRTMLNWNEVQGMAKDGITIGSHSHTHPILSRMPIQKAKEEILESKKILEENLSIKVKHFAFPNGVIYIHTGILARMDNEAQLATLLAHEMTHATHRHLVKQFRDIKIKQLFLLR